ncbi:MAG: hypothetical protein SF052_06215 [Bacteroidia bacterium]|nr:hypothetical protein [Bacteroidia bacterium]
MPSFKIFSNAVGFFVIVLFTACGGTWELAHVTVREPQGLERKKEYVEVFFPITEAPSIPAQICMIYGADEGHVPVQFRQMPDNPELIHAVFPVTLPPQGIRHISLLACKDTTHQVSGSLMIRGEEPGFVLENPFFVADLGTSTDIPTRNYPPGHLTSLLLKEFDNLRLQRSGMKIHWSPNFAKDSLSYKTMADLDADSFDIFRGGYMVRMKKSGTIPGYEEIFLQGEYTFYDSLPYFLFSSDMEIQQTTALYLLRNDEMTVDSMFTHLAFRRKNGEIEHLALYESATFSHLDTFPLEADAPWLYFYHAEKGFAIGSVRIDYDNTAADGTGSPLYKAHTKITPSAQNGRYWNRRLIHDQTTEIPEGSRYREKNAYIVFRFSEKSGDILMDNLYERLTYPLRLEVK